MPPRKGQMATPATRRDSHELAEEAAERDAYGMDVDYESPTPRPQSNEELVQAMQQMQSIVKSQSDQINDLKQMVQTNNSRPQHQQNPPYMDDLMRWVQSNTNPIEKEEERIVRTSELYWRDHGFKLTGRENFAL